jgi:S1-C subfamily serine protease
MRYHLPPKIGVNTMRLRSRFASPILALAAALCLVLALPTDEAAAQQPSTDEVLKAIVKIDTSVPSDARSAETLGTTRQGHGVLIGDDGLILTIGYLVLEADQVTVTQHDGRELPAAVIAYDHDSGFGLVRTARPVNAKPLALGDSGALKTESVAVAAGHGGPSMAMPVRIAARRDFTGYWEYLLEDALFTTPPFPNFGGAALLNQDGRLVGIGSLLVADAEEAGTFGPGNMFIPINRFKPIKQDLVTAGRTRQPSHPWLGLYTEEVRGRLFVQRVAKGGPSAAAGIRPGDIIISVGDTPVQTQKDLYRRIWSSGAPGVRISITVLTASAGLRTIDVVSIDRYAWLKQPKGN